MDKRKVERRVTEHRRQGTCSAHSGIESDLEAGRACMTRLEKGLEKLREEFSTHVESSAKSTIALLVGILLCFLTGVIGIYVNSVSLQKECSNQTEVNLLVKEITKALEGANN